MKTGIHPTWYHNAVVTCSCGNSFVTGATTQTVAVDICSGCHPFFTGEQRFADRQGRIDKFMAKVKRAESNKAQSKPAKKATETSSNEPQSYKDILRQQQSALRKQRSAQTDTVTE